MVIADADITAAERGLRAVLREAGYEQYVTEDWRRRAAWFMIRELDHDRAIRMPMPKASPIPQASPPPPLPDKPHHWWDWLLPR